MFVGIAEVKHYNRMLLAPSIESKICVIRSRELSCFGGYFFIFCLFSSIIIFYRKKTIKLSAIASSFEEAAHQLYSCKIGKSHLVP